MKRRDGLTFLPIAELSARIRSGALSPIRLAEACLERIEAIAPRLSCFVTVTAGVALAQAREAEAEVRKGRWRGPLHGIPYGLKDLLDTKDVRTTWGAPPFVDRMPRKDAAVVRRLHETGAVLLGKLAMPELAGALGCMSPHASLSGACRNPWDENRWTGGSSSGSAAAVAAGLVTFAIASETLGSLTAPAAFCGVTGLRPTYGLVSQDGAMNYAYSFDTIGPMARTAADCALVLAALCEPDRLDGTGVEASRALTSLPLRRAKGLRAGVLAMPDHPAVSREAGPAYRKALRVLADAGVTLEPVSLPSLPYGEVCSVLVVAEAYSAFEDFIRSGGCQRLSERAHQGRSPESYIPGATSADYVKAMRVRTQVQQVMSRVLDRFDFLVSPNNPCAPPLVDQPHRAMSLAPASVLEGADNLAGLPALALPMGFGVPGRLPLGFQLIGQPLDEALLASVAMEYQSRTRWHLERPPTG